MPGLLPFRSKYKQCESGCFVCIAPIKNWQFQINVLSTLLMTYEMVLKKHDVLSAQMKSQKV